MKRFITLSFLLSTLLLSCTSNKTNPTTQVDAGTAGVVGIGGGAGTAGTCDASECTIGIAGTAIAGAGGR